MQKLNDYYTIENNSRLKYRGPSRSTTLTVA